MGEFNLRKRVYVAGAYTAPNVTDVLENMRIGMRASTELLLMGLAPFCPWLDYHYQLQLRDEETLRVEDYYDYTKAWLAVADAMFVVANPANALSQGLAAEIKLAEWLNIPIFTDMEELRKWADGKTTLANYGMTLSPPTP